MIQTPKKVFYELVENTFEFRSPVKYLVNVLERLVVSLENCIQEDPSQGSADPIIIFYLL
jgi:hypothetical protein